MSSATNIPSGGLVTFIVKVDGTKIPDEMRVHAVHIEKEVNRITTAKVTILDGQANLGTFKASSSKTYLPGAKLSVEAGYDSKNRVIFKGIISRQTIQINSSIGSALIVECRDEAVKLIVGRKSSTYIKKKDSEIISSIIEKYSGVSSEVTSTSTVWPQQVQFYVSDWDYILSRAEANGLIVTTLNGKITVAKPNADTSSVLTITYGDNLLEINADLNSVTQLNSAKANSWDYKEQEVATGEASNDHSGPGNLSSKKLAEVIALSDYELQTTAALSKADLTNWCKAQLIKSEYSKIQGEVKFQGSTVVEAGKYITLKGVGDRFNGDHLISGLTHDISDGNWITEVSLGLSANWFTEKPDVMAPPASGLLAGAQGLFNGTVKKIYEDPDTQFRILVDVPMFDQNGEGIWARLSNFYSTSGAGAFFLPEIGDEVVLGFLNEDPRFPIILGSLYSSTKLKPFEGLEPNEKNNLKAIVSKSGIYIQFDDENKVLTITTPSKNTAILSDKDKSITVQDQNENSIVMSESGITMKSPKNISVEADQQLTLKGNQGVKIQAPEGDVEVSAINIRETADSQFSVEGNETAQINSGEILSLQSSLITIN